MTNNNRLTNEELAQIKERAEKATRGKWSFVPIDDSLEYFIVGEDGNEAVASEVFMINDAAFIAHARTDIPKLIAEVEYRREKQAELLEYNRQYFAEIKRLRAEVTRLEMEALK